MRATTDLGTPAGPEDLADEMRHAAAAGGIEVKRVRLCFGERDQIFHRFDRDRRMDRHIHRQAGCEPNVRGSCDHARTHRLREHFSNNYTSFVARRSQRAATR
jgi:hypothetical protein